MKIKFLLLPLVLLLLFPLTRAISVREISQSFGFNFIVLFLIIFLVCFFVLNSILNSAKGITILIALVLGFGGSFGVLKQYAFILQKVDLWVILLIIGLVIFLIRAIFPKKADEPPGPNAGTVIVFFAIPLAWFLFARKMSMSVFNSSILNVADIIAGILFVLAIIVLLFIVLETNEQKQKRYEEHYREMARRRH